MTTTTQQVRAPLQNAVGGAARGAATVGSERLTSARAAAPSSARPLPHSPAQVTSIMGNLAKNVPMHTWLGALPQLISRMCHPCKEVSELAKQIIVRITQVGAAPLRGRRLGCGQGKARRRCACVVPACACRCPAPPPPRPGTPAGLPAPVAVEPGGGEQVGGGGAAGGRICHHQRCQEEHGSGHVWCVPGFVVGAWCGGPPGGQHGGLPGTNPTPRVAPEPSPTPPTPPRSRDQLIL